MANLDGTGGADKLDGRDGADNVRGNGGRDALSGGAGSDNMWGGGGNDAMSGGTGDDVMIGSQGASKLANMKSFEIHQDAKGKIVFEGESAGYKNTLGMYKIAADGTIYDTEIVFANASLKNSGGNLVSGQSSHEFNLKAGERVGFFVVPNSYDQKGMDRLLDDTKGSWKIVDMATGKDGNINDSGTKLVHVAPNGKETDIKSQYGVDMFHSVSAAANRDGLDHVTGGTEALEGTVRIGFEDLWKGGDKDFDDSVFTVDIGIENVMKLGTVQGKAARWQDHDTMDGGDGNDRMYGVSGNDTMDGGTGNDKMAGGSGNDVLSGGAGNDLVMGNAGDDRLVADAGDDALYGGSGFDTVDFSSAAGSVAVSLNAHVATGHGSDKIWGVEAVVGSAFADALDGDKRANTLDGSAGDDVLRGRGGADVLTGGEGNDVFVWHTKDLGAVDTITDFAVGDVLDLSRLFKGVEGDRSKFVTFSDTDMGLKVSAMIGGKAVDIATLEGQHDQAVFANGVLLG